MSKDKDSERKAALLAEIKAFRDEAQSYWSDIYDQGREDKEFVTIKGAQWESGAVAARKAKNQASLEFNLTGTFCRQQINIQRQNRPQAQVIPVDSEADVETAKILQGLIKDTEEATDFDNVADTAAENAVYGGLGFYRIGTDYIDANSFQQEPKFLPIVNTEAVLIDPLSKALDGSDMSRALVAEWVAKDPLIKQHGEDAADNFDMATVSDWSNEQDNTVCVVEYFYKEEVATTLYLFADGSTAFADDLTDEQKEAAVKERPSTKTVIKWAKASGCKILEEGEFPGKYIPIIPVYGEVRWIGNKRHVFSLVHFAKDPQRLFNYWKSVEATILNKQQDDLMVVDGKAIAGYETEWRNPGQHKFLRINTVDKDTGQNILMPTRISPTQPPVAVMNAAMGAQQAITDILNMHAPVMGAQGNETSGVAIQKRQQQSETAQFHFQDNLNKSIRHSSRILLEVYRAVYDTEVVRRIIGMDGEASMTKLNAQPTEQDDPQKASINGLLNDISVGRYDVRMDTGPSYNTQRDQNFQMMMQLMQFNPELFQVIGDILLKDSPLINAKEISERVKMTIPEQIRNAGKGEQQLPPEIQAQIQQLDQVIQQMSQALEQAQAELQDKNADREKDIIIAQINAANRTDVQELKGTAEIIKQYMTQMGSIQQALQQLPQQWLQSGDSMNNYGADAGQPQPQQIEQLPPQPEQVPPDPAQNPMNDPATEQGFFMGNDPSPDQAQPFAPESNQFGNDAPPMINEDFQP